MAQIAIFDSGIGGTYILDRVRERAPWSDLIYVADHAFGPYGERTLDEVRLRTEILARYLVSAGVTEIVIACNSASAAALHHLREQMPQIAFVGMEPALKPAVELTKTGTVAVLATGTTFEGELFRSLVGQHGTTVNVFEQACPGLAAAVENREPVGSLLDEFLPNVVASGADVVVLGCTHYPFIRSEIEDRLPAGTVLVDPSEAVAKRVVQVAQEHDIDLKAAASTLYWTTDLETDRGDDREWATIDIPRATAAAVRICSTTLSAVQGDMTSMPVGAVVNAANNELNHGGGIALAIASAGGPAVVEESAEWSQRHGLLEPGTAALTSAGNMPSSYVIHVAGPIHEAGQDNEELLAAAVFAALDSANAIGVVSIAMPAISAGTYGYPPEEATAVIAASVALVLDVEETPLRSVRLVGFDTAMTTRFVAAIASDA